MGTVMATAMATAKDEDFRNEVLRLAGDEVRTCIQCGTCSGQLSHRPSYESQHKKAGQALSGGKTGGGTA